MKKKNKTLNPFDKGVMEKISQDLDALYQDPNIEAYLNNLYAQQLAPDTQAYMADLPKQQQQVQQQVVPEEEQLSPEEIAQLMYYFQQYG